MLQQELEIDGVHKWVLFTAKDSRTIWDISSLEWGHWLQCINLNWELDEVYLKIKEVNKIVTTEKCIDSDCKTEIEDWL